MRHLYVKVCPGCGKSFETRYKKAVCCSRACSNLNRSRTLRTLKYQRSAAGKRSAMLGRLADRDAAYAENAAPVTIEQRGNVVTEWRGQRFIGCHAVANVHHR